jgi:hypothetical protein
VCDPRYRSRSEYYQNKSVRLPTVIFFLADRSWESVAPLRFQSKLIRPEGVGTWTFAEIPQATSAKAALRSHQRVKGTIDGAPFSSSLIPRGGGILFIVVNSELRQKIGKVAGGIVEVVMELDLAPVSIELPPALQRALDRDRPAHKAFEALAPSHRKAFTRWITEAKQEETRGRRVEKALKMLHEGETLN